MLKTAKAINTRYYLIQYDENTFRLLKNKYQLDKGWELCQNSFWLGELYDYCFSDSSSYSPDSEFKQSENLRVALTRSKSRIRELALCNHFEFFGTLTLNGYLCDRYELDDAQNELKKVLKKIKRNNTDFKYIIITEKHKDGAFHFHRFIFSVLNYL